MLDMIINFLTYALCFFLAAAAIGGTILFFVAATWMQAHDERSAGHGKA